MERLRKLTLGMIRLLIIGLLFSSCLSQKKVMLLQDKGSKDIQVNFTNKKKSEK